jgi:hypothetical protein
MMGTADAESLGARMTQMTGDTHMVVQAEAPMSLVSSFLAHNGATEGPGVLINTENLELVRSRNARLRRFPPMCA